MKIRDFFDEAWYINLDARPDRREEVETEFRHIGIDRLVRRFAAITPEVRTPENCVIASGQSHLAIIADAKSRGLENVLIFEDDVMFPPGGRAIIERALDELARRDDWDLFYFSANIFEDPLERVDDHLLRVQGCYCIHAYAVHARAFDRVLEYRPRDEPFDAFLTRVPFVRYSAYPLAASQREGMSDNVGGVTAYDEIFRRVYAREALWVDPQRRFPRMRVARATPDGGAALPDDQHMLLLKAALLPAGAAATAWQRWCDGYRARDGVVDVASYRLLPLVYCNLEGVADDALMSRLKRIRQGVWLANRRQLEACARLLEALAIQGLDAIVLKGAALVSRDYADSGGRVLGDIDLLMRWDDIEPALRLLARLGWKLDAQDIEAIGREPRFRHLRHAVTLRDATGCQLDLHWHALAQRLDDRLDDAFRDAATSLNVGGVRGRALCPEDALLHVCVHGLAWAPEVPVRWIADAAMIARRAGAGFRWERVVEMARLAHASVAMREALRWLAGFVDVPVEVRSALATIPATAQERRLFRANLAGSGLLGGLPRLWCEFQMLRGPLRVNDGPRGIDEFPRFVRSSLGLGDNRALARWVAGRAVRRLGLVDAIAPVAELEYEEAEALPLQASSGEAGPPRSPADGDRIFVSLASFCDPWLVATVRDACAKARNPSRLVFGVVEQEVHSRRQALADIVSAAGATLRYVHVQPEQSMGVSWARSLAFALFRGEEKLLQIDSHMAFETAWDATLQRQHLAVSARYPKAVITTYPPDCRVDGDVLVRTRHETDADVAVLRPIESQPFDVENPILRFSPHCLALTVPIEGAHIAAGYLFASGNFVEEVPYDPQLYFHGEEHSLSLRAWTRGWDILHLPDTPVAHLYRTAESTDRSLHWHSDWDELRPLRHYELSAQTVRRFLRMIRGELPPGPYALGAERSLDDYARRFGIDYRNFRYDPEYRENGYFQVTPVSERVAGATSSVESPLPEVQPG